MTFSFSTLTNLSFSHHHLSFPLFPSLTFLTSPSLIIISLNPPLSSLPLPSLPFLNHFLITLPILSPLYLLYNFLTDNSNGENTRMISPSQVVSRLALCSHGTLGTAKVALCRGPTGRGQTSVIMLQGRPQLV